MTHHAAAPVDGSDEDVEMDGETPLKTKFLNQTNGRFYIMVTCDQYSYERMVAFSRANQIRLTRAARTLQERHDAEAAQGNWEEAANCLPTSFV